MRAWLLPYLTRGGYVAQSPLPMWPLGSHRNPKSPITHTGSVPALQRHILVAVFLHPGSMVTLRQIVFPASTAHTRQHGAGYTGQVRVRHRLQGHGTSEVVLLGYYGPIVYIDAVWIQHKLGSTVATEMLQVIIWLSNFPLIEYATS